MRIVLGKPLSLFVTAFLSRLQSLGSWLQSTPTVALAAAANPLPMRIVAVSARRDR